MNIDEVLIKAKSNRNGDGDGKKLPDEEAVILGVRKKRQTKNNSKRKKNHTNGQTIRIHQLRNQIFTPNT